MSSQKLSLIKRLGQSAKVEFQQLHLAVFPIEVQFNKPVDYTSIYYFEKGHQIITSKSRTPLQAGPNQKDAKHQFLQQQNAIYFRIHSQKNLIYKWSVYKQHPNEQQEYLQSCSFNLKQIITNIIMPLRSESIKSYQSMISYSFNERLFRCRFQASGLMVKFLLIVSNDPQKIKQTVRRNSSLKNRQKQHQTLPMIQFTSIVKNLPEKIKDIFERNIEEAATVDNEDQCFLAAYSLLTEPEIQIKKPNKSSNSFKKEEKSLSLGQRSKVFQDSHLLLDIGCMKSKKVSSQNNTKSLDLDQVILNEVEKKFNDIPSQAPSQSELLKFGVEKPKQISSQVLSQAELLNFGVEKPKQESPSNDYNVTLNANMLNLPNNSDKKRDYGILKLQSDALKQQQEDVQLQKQEYKNLQVIEQEKTSIRPNDLSSFRTSFLPSHRPDSFLKTKVQQKVKPKQEIAEKQNVFYSNSKMKNILLCLLFLSIAILIAASAMDSKQKKKHLKNIKKER